MAHFPRARQKDSPPHGTRRCPEPHSGLVQIGPNVGYHQVIEQISQRISPEKQQLVRGTMANPMEISPADTQKKEDKRAVQVPPTASNKAAPSRIETICPKLEMMGALDHGEMHEEPAPQSRSAHPRGRTRLPFGST